MTALDIPGIKDTEFEASAAVDGDALVFRMWGNADLRVNGPLGPFLDSVDHEARRRSAREVVADLRELVFMNSACLKEFVRWVAHVEERGGGAYYIRFLSDPTAQWQTRSLQALRAFAPSLISIEADVPAAGQ
jgi:hypothetical protein